MSTTETKFLEKIAKDCFGRIKILNAEVGMLVSNPDRTPKALEDFTLVEFKKLINILLALEEHRDFFKEAVDGVEGGILDMTRILNKIYENNPTISSAIKKENETAHDFN